MLYLLFYIDNDRYVIDAARVVEVVPLVKFKKIPKSPAYVAGLFNYRGSPVPVIDLRRYTDTRDITSYMCTRIILVTYRLDDNDQQYIIGVIADHVTDTIKRDSSEFIESGVNRSDNPYMAKIATDDDGILQWVDIKNIVPKDVENLLFT